jgi:GNAT superfamily N-acetyltransferase
VLALTSDMRQKRTFGAETGDHETVSDARPNGQLTIRRADAGDVDGVACLAGELAQSFTFSPTRFQVTYPALLADDGACLLLAVQGEERLGYLLAFRHLTFYANGPTAWVEEVFVRRQERDRGIGRALMSAFEQWAAAQGCGLIALATRRAAPFYRALGYEESAVYFRKVLEDQASE